jgi:hypothetical protein
MRPGRGPVASGAHDPRADINRVEIPHRLEATLKDAIPFSSRKTFALVLKYFDQLARILREQDSKLRPWGKDSFTPR